MDHTESSVLISEREILEIRDPLDRRRYLVRTPQGRVSGLTRPLWRPLVKTASVTGGGPGIGASLVDIRAALGPVTILVNAAGREPFRRFTDINSEEWKKIVDINLHRVFHKPCPGMRRGRHGRQRRGTSFVGAPTLRKADARGYLGPAEAAIHRTPVGRTGRREDFAAADASFSSEETGQIPGVTADETPERRKPQCFSRDFDIR